MPEGLPRGLPTRMEDEPSEVFGGLRRGETKARRRKAVAERHRAVAAAKRWGSEVTPEGRLKVGGRSKMIERAREEMEEDWRKQLKEFHGKLNAAMSAGETGDVARYAQEIARVAEELESASEARERHKEYKSEWYQVGGEGGLWQRWGIDNTDRPYLRRGSMVRIDDYLAAKLVGYDGKTGDALVVDPLDHTGEKVRRIPQTELYRLNLPPGREEQPGAPEQQLDQELDRFAGEVGSIFDRWAGAVSKLVEKFKAAGAVVGLSVRSLVEAPEFLFKEWRLGKAEEKVKKYQERLADDLRYYRERIESEQAAVRARIAEEEENFQKRRAKLEQDIADEQADFYKEFAGKRGWGWRVIKGLRKHLMLNRQRRRVAALKREKVRVVRGITDAYDDFQEDLLARRNKAMEYDDKQLTRAMTLQEKWQRRAASTRETHERLSEALQALFS